MTCEVCKKRVSILKLKDGLCEECILEKSTKKTEPKIEAEASELSETQMLLEAQKVTNKHLDRISRNVRFWFYLLIVSIAFWLFYGIVQITN